MFRRAHEVIQKTRDANNRQLPRLKGAARATVNQQNFLLQARARVHAPSQDNHS